MAFFGGELAVFQAAFHIQRAAFFDVLAQNFGQLIKERDAVPFSAFDVFASVFVFAAAGGGNADIGNRLTAR